jgi:hypothetical protein
MKKIDTKQMEKLDFTFSNHRKRVKEIKPGAQFPMKRAEGNSLKIFHLDLFPFYGDGAAAADAK